MTASFIGCKISLISKSEIRYEGILYTIDTKESTIALAKVRSFGTEDRVTDKPVAPRNEVYEYIIFRASDIKDLLVDDPPASSPGLTDPAIIQAQSGGGSAPQSTPSSQSQSPSFPAPQPRTTSVSSGYSNQKTTLSNVLASATGSQQPQSQTGPIQVNQSQRRQQDASDRSPPGTRPQAQPRSQQPVHQSEDRTGGARGPQSQQQRPQPQDRRPAQQQQQTGGLPVNQQREQRDQRGDQRDNRPQGQQQPYSQNRDQRQGQGMGQQFQRRNDGQQQQQNRGYGRNQGMQQQRPFQQQDRRTQQSDWPTGGQRRDGQNRGPIQPRPRMLDVRKLEEYDFEKANAEFEELTKDVADMTVTDAEKKEPAVAPTDESEPETYNKQKSFFDSISCEAIERKRGNSSRIDRRVERKQNQETFGVTHLYNNRWNQGYGRGFRGGRGGGNYRNNSNRGYYNRDNNNTNSNNSNANANTNH